MIGGNQRSLGFDTIDIALLRVCLAAPTRMPQLRCSSDVASRRGSRVWAGVVDGAEQPMRHGVSARRSSPLQLMWLDRIWTSPRGAGGNKLHRMPMRRERSARIRRGSNMRVQWPGAAPGRITWWEANGWRSAIDGVERKRKRGTGCASREDPSARSGNLGYI